MAWDELVEKIERLHDGAKSDRAKDPSNDYVFGRMIAYGLAAKWIRDELRDQRADAQAMEVDPWATADPWATVGDVRRMIDDEFGGFVHVLTNALRRQ